MFRLSLLPANPTITTRWFTLCGYAAAGAGVITIASLVSQIRNLFPYYVFHRFPEYEMFIHMAIAIPLITGLLLIYFRRVLCVSFAQLGFATGLIYIALSMWGVFMQGYEMVIVLVLLMMLVILMLIFSTGIVFAYSQKNWSDVTLGIVFLILFAAIWVFPLWKAWRHP